MKAWLLHKGDKLIVLGVREVVAKVSRHESGPPMLRIDFESGRYASCEETADFKTAARA